MSYRIGIDVGGTFTDLIVSDEQARVRMFKVPSTPGGPALGVQEAVKRAAQDYGKGLRDFLGETEAFVHGTTVSTNAVLERRAAKTGMLVTQGFRHILYYRDGQKQDTFNLKMKHTEPYVPIYLTLPVEERVRVDGAVEAPLNEETARQAIRRLKAWKVEAIGVCFLWSIVNPTHELRVGRLIEEEWPGIPYSLSHQVQPVLREFVRMSSTALDASLKPIVSQYCAELQDWLERNGFRHEMLMIVATGGIMGVRESVRRPVYIVFSGPTMGPVAGLLYGSEQGDNSVVTIDMGGTSFDVACAAEGEILRTSMARIAEFPTGITSVEINSIGAGGGSIAWVDTAGLLHVGPRSAGAVPGPACYLRGGQEPTVTDANVVLGYLDPDFFLGGGMRLDAQRARGAIEEKVARPLQLDAVQAALGIFKLVNQNMVNGILRITLRYGFDPRDLLLVVGGGAGPAHAAFLAQELNMPRVLIPKMAGALCALGALNTDMRFDFSGSCNTNSQDFAYEGVNRVLEEMEARGKRALEDAGIPPERKQFESFVEARYPGQIYTLPIRLPNGRVRPEDVPWIVEAFHGLHEKRYVTSERDSFLEMLEWRVSATGVMPKMRLPEQPAVGQDASAALKGRRPAYFEGLGGMVDTPVYDGTRLAHGMMFEGPAIIDDLASTPVIPPGARVTVTRWGDYYMELR